MIGAVRIAILAASAPVAAFFFGIALHAAHVYLKPVGDRWSLTDLYLTGGGWVFAGLAWLALFLVLRRGLSPRTSGVLLGLFAVATGLSCGAAHLAQDGGTTDRLTQARYWIA